MLKTTEFDVAEYLDTEELRKGYLELVAKDGTQAELLRAINAVARARGMTETAKEAGITREGLYKALSPNDELHLYKHGNIGRSCPKRKGRSGYFS